MHHNTQFLYRYLGVWAWVLMSKDFAHWTISPACKMCFISCIIYVHAIPSSVPFLGLFFLVFPVVLLVVQCVLAVQAVLLWAFITIAYFHPPDSSPLYTSFNSKHMHVNLLWKTVDESYFSQIGFFFIAIPAALTASLCDFYSFCT